MMNTYKTHGTCCRQINFEIEDNILTKLEFVGGCTGNTQGVTKLALGKNIDEIIEKLQGINCRNNTSCPDQLAIALKKYKQQRGE